MLKKRVVKDKETRIKFACLAITSVGVSFNLLVSNLIKKDEIALSQDSVAIQGYVGAIQPAMIADVPKLKEEVNQHPVAEVMPILLKSGQSASREEAAEKRKPRRSMQHSARRSMEFPDRWFFDDILVYNTFFDKPAAQLKLDITDSECVNLNLNDIGVYNTFFDMITHLTCPKRAEKCTGKKRGYTDESLAKLEMQQSNLGNSLAASFYIRAVRGVIYQQPQGINQQTRLLWKLNSSGSHVELESCPNLLRKSQSYLWRPGEHAKVIDHVFKNYFSIDYTDMMHLFLSKEPCADYKEAWKHTRRKNKHEEDKRFKPPDLNQHNHEDIPGFILIKETPPDAAYNPKPSKNRFGIRLLLFDKFSFANLLAMKRGFLGPSRKEPAGLCTIRKSKREVSIDTLQATSIDSIHHQSIDAIHPTSIDQRQAAVIDRANKSSKNTVHRGTIHREHHPRISSIHISTRAMKRGFPGPSRKEPAGLCTIRKSKREVSIDTLQAASIDNIHHQSIDTIHPTSIDKRQSSNNIVLPGIVYHNTIHPGTVHPDTIHHDTIHYVSENIVHPGSIDTVHPVEHDEDFEIPTTHVKQPDIQVHHADECKQKDELNREKLVNHDTVKDDEYHVSGEQSKVEEADTKDPTSALIDSSNSESIDIRTSETIDTDICHRSIPSTIPDATTDEHHLRRDREGRSAHT
ncbi:hypothetical protein F2Q68_00020430 [Brassica cretica]|uniref:Uncharacterized protein n=1 Tax=Brassica cretica TaxID=69181 RepID=A0A8S9G0D6_BRACR|nr:hypothetical protein F2Q68_00020430 [Brassica cretica]